VYVDDRIDLRVRCGISNQTLSMAVVIPAAARLSWLYANGGAQFPEIVGTGSIQYLSPPLAPGPYLFDVIAPDGTWARSVHLRLVSVCSYYGRVLSD